MVMLTKRRARKPLAHGRASYSWTSGVIQGEETFNVQARNEDTEASFTLHLSRNEALGFIGFVASHEAFVYGIGKGGMGWTDRRTLPERLRALADKIEKEGK